MVSMILFMVFYPFSPPTLDRVGRIELYLLNVKSAVLADPLVFCKGT